MPACSREARAAAGTRVAALSMWRAGETVVLEWRDVVVRAGTPLVRRGKGGRGQAAPLHQNLASQFGNWRTSYGPRDSIVGLTRRRLRVVIEHAALDRESPGTGRLMAGAHSHSLSAAKHRLTTAPGFC